VDQTESEIGEPAPEADGQEGHEKGMGAEVGRQGEVRVQERRATDFLQAREIGSLPADEGDEPLS
jgi:hypothetical protein